MQSPYVICVDRNEKFDTAARHRYCVSVECVENATAADLARDQFPSIRDVTNTLRIEYLLLTHNIHVLLLRSNLAQNLVLVANFSTIFSIFFSKGSLFGPVC